MDREMLKFQQKMAQGRVKKLFKSEDVYREERNKLESMSKDIRISPKGRDAVKRHMEENHAQLNKKRLVVDERRASEHDKFVEYNVKKAIERGELPKPKMDAQRERFIKRAR